MDRKAIQDKASDDLVSILKQEQDSGAAFESAIMSCVLYVLTEVRVAAETREEEMRRAAEFVKGGMR